MINTNPESKSLLSIKDLRTHFFTHEGVVKAVDGVSFTLDKGKTLSIVGESGCGKTMLSLSILRLIPDPPGRIVGGEIIFDGIDILKLSKKELRSIRGNRISMIFQEPMTSLNPVFTIGSQIAETILLHQKSRASNRKQALKIAVEMLDIVGIAQPEKRINEYPHQMSGGMRQRVMIAMALSCRPDLLIADEPTTALDVTTQAQVLELIENLKDELNTSVIFVTHDLGIVGQTCDEVAVMYAGKVVEFAATKDIFDNPLHPYTKGLMNSAPNPGDSAKNKRLTAIPGTVPGLKDMPLGCRFVTRCNAKFDKCVEMPPEITLENGRKVLCWWYA
jgi:oligopeptide/dipeptide ABC transporter ATP-binding protein